MKAKEKAKEIFDKMFNVEDALANYPMCFDTAKQCSLIAVEEIIRANPHSNPFNTDVHSTMKYWLDVKQEIQKL